ncbi:MAG: hypothetical protein KBG28_18730 [Kofleriaceae bacterium]|jgi:hypothetical protein|nr:hypothetical protein [Kofleriaceae bacterium]MBP6835686.1 hypothetical protein [Kofleriaceae bacterium]MBP9206018.1 hypothetical protein [Kofleriaceae bacterium]
MTFKHLVGAVAMSVTMSLALGACGGGGSADVEAFIKLDSEKAAAFAVGGDDCDAKAKSVGDWRKANTTKYKAMQDKLKKQWPKGPPKEVTEKHGEKLQANKKAVMDAMLTCTGNEAFNKMMDDTRDL